MAPSPWSRFADRSFWGEGGGGRGGADGSAAAPRVVLVPPDVQRDLRGRSRFAKPAFDYLFSRRNMRRLLGDFLDLGGGPTGVLYFSPPADPKLSIRGKLSLRNSNMLMRYQPQGPEQMHTFAELKADATKPGGVLLRVCHLDMTSGLGVFGSAPVAGRIAERAEVGVRYSSPLWTTGMVVRPGATELSTLWLAGRHAGITAGVQISRPPGSASPLQAGDAAEWLRRHSRVALAYTPPAGATSGITGRNSFTAGVELMQARRLCASFHQHFAVNRRVVNPLEKSGVIGITNYIDIGMLLCATVGEESGASAKAPASPAAALRGEQLPPPGVNLAAAWQVNKNWLVKARLGSDSCAAAAGFRAWFNPSYMVVASVSYDYGGAPAGLPRAFSMFDKIGGVPGLRWGVAIQVENFGDMRYERGFQALRGQALLQRHEATAVDIANYRGSTGHVVRVDEADSGDAMPMTSSDAAANLM